MMDKKIKQLVCCVSTLAVMLLTSAPASYAIMVPYDEGGSAVSVEEDNSSSAGASSQERPQPKQNSESAVISNQQETVIVASEHEEQVPFVAKLYFRFSAENDIYACYLTENCSPDEIYSLSRESLVRADIVDSLEDRSFELPGEEDLRNLLKSGVSLDDAYNAYEIVDNHADLYLNCEGALSYLSDSLKEAVDREAMPEKQEIPNGVAGYAKAHRNNSERHEEKNAER